MKIARLLALKKREGRGAVCPPVFQGSLPGGGGGRAAPEASRDICVGLIFSLGNSTNAAVTMSDAELLDLMQFDLLNEFSGVPVTLTPSQTKCRHRLRPLAVRRREAARLSGVSVSTWRRWDAAGATPPSVTVGKLTLWPMRSLRLWMRWGCPSRGEFERRLQTTEAARRTNADQDG